jgi:hypothetical protein
MIGHQHIRVQRTSGVFKRFRSPVAVTDVIIFSKETRISIVSTLHNVQRHIWQMNSAAAGHGSFHVLIK